MVLQNRSSGSLAADGSLSYIHCMPGAPVNYYFATALWSCKVSEPRRLLQETQGPGNLDSDLGRAAGDLLGSHVRGVVRNTVIGSSIRLMFVADNATILAFDMSSVRLSKTSSPVPSAGQEMVTSLVSSGCSLR
jgi:hypothetical protein